MPEDVFDRKLINGAQDQFCQTLRAHGWLHFRHSLVKRFAVNTIPPKPVVPRNHELYTVLKESRDGLIHFYPWRMSPLNVGSNRGLLKLLKEIDDGIACDAPIRFLVADCNIFVRIMKVRSPRHAPSRSGFTVSVVSLDLHKHPEHHHPRSMINSHLHAFYVHHECEGSSTTAIIINGPAPQPLSLMGRHSHYY